MRYRCRAPAHKPNANEIVINTQLPVQNALNVSRALLSQLVHMGDNVESVQVGVYGKPQSVILNRRMYRGGLCWVLKEKDMDALCNLLSVTRTTKAKADVTEPTSPKDSFSSCFSGALHLDIPSSRVITSYA